jgi:hypothetical protein
MLIFTRSAIVATGSVALPLKCTTTTGVTGTPDDVVNTCIDTSSAHSVEGQQVAKKQLPDFSLVTAYPVKGGCTFDSIVDPTWYMRGMFFESGAVPAGDPDNTTLNRFTCGLTGPGFADFFFYEFEPLSGQGIDTMLVKPETVFVFLLIVSKILDTIATMSSTANLAKSIGTVNLVLTHSTKS